MEKPVCVLDKVQKKYGKKNIVLGPASFSINSGEILGLTGKNGAGKSTLLKIIAGIVRPDMGCCIWNQDCKSAIAYVPQEIALYENLSGRENLEFWGRVYGLPQKVISRRSRWLLEKMELEQKTDTIVSAYSGGMSRRLHLASALMITPALLLLDEPTVGADSHSVELILSFLEHLKKMQCAVVWVNHQSDEMRKISDRILTVENGQILREERCR